MMMMMNVRRRSVHGRARSCVLTSTNVFIFALILRLLVGTHSYSGFSGNRPLEMETAMKTATIRRRRTYTLTRALSWLTGVSAAGEGEGDVVTSCEHAASSSSSRRASCLRKRGKGRRDSVDSAWRYGDYEAQRHWMEVAMHLEPTMWYGYNLEYWGVDYPPLTMYQSYLHAHLITWIAVDGHDAMELDASRGYESTSSKRAMRVTAIISEMMMLWPAALAAARACARDNIRGEAERERIPGVGVGVDVGVGAEMIWMETALLLAVCLIQPVLVLIDHGHFQYNSASLGLSLGAAVLIVRESQGSRHRHRARVNGDDTGGTMGRRTSARKDTTWASSTALHLAGAMLYTLAFTHKHIALYYSLAFFAHLLGAAVQLGSIRRTALRVCALGITVGITLCVVLAPWILEGREAVMGVFARLFPLQRGVFEDYVANFWCATNPVARWKAFGRERVAGLGAVMTLGAAMPSVVLQIVRPKSTITSLLLGMFNSSLAFFLFGFQVHEKSILYPLLPASLLIARFPSTMLPFTAAATLSIAPLIRKDGLVVAMPAVAAVYAGVVLTGSAWRSHAMADAPPVLLETGFELSSRTARRIAVLLRRGWRAGTAGALCIGASAAVALACGAPAPRRLPYIYDLVIAASCFAVFLGSFVAANVLQWQLASTTTKASLTLSAHTLVRDKGHKAKRL